MSLYTYDGLECSDAAVFYRIVDILIILGQLGHVEIKKVPPPTLLMPSARPGERILLSHCIGVARAVKEGRQIAWSALCTHQKGTLQVAQQVWRTQGKRITLKRGYVSREHCPQLGIFVDLCRQFESTDLEQKELYRSFLVVELEQCEWAGEPRLL